MKKRVLSLLLAGVLASGLFTSAGAAQLTFSDVPTEHWASEAIVDMTQRGLFSGTAAPVDGVGTFSPDAVMTRGSFVAVLTRWLFEAELSALPAQPAANWWQNNYDLALKNNLLKSGELDGDMDSAMTRQEMAVVLARACDGLGLAPDTLVDTSSIPDWSAITASYREGVRTVYSMGLIGGVDSKGTFNPSGTLSRAQAATVLYRLMGALGSAQPVWDASRVDLSATNMEQVLPQVSNRTGLIRLQDWNPAGMTRSIAAGKALAAKYLDPMGKPGFVKATDQALILGLMDEKGNYIQYGTTLTQLDGGYVCLAISQSVSDVPMWSEAATPYFDAILSETVPDVVRTYIIAMYRDMTERMVAEENGVDTKGYKAWRTNYYNKEYTFSTLGYPISVIFSNDIAVFDTGGEVLYERAQLPATQWSWYNEANRPL